MNNFKRFRATLAAAALLVVPVMTNGCDGTDQLCCSGDTDFKIGGTVTASLSSNAQAQVVAQAVADFAGIASAAVDDITTACRSIAQDLDAPTAEQAAEDAKTDRNEKMKGWCALAVKQIGSVKAQMNASGKVDVELVVEGPKCSASVSAKANCEAKCSVDGKCDIKANPPKCTGGKLEIACKGSCSGSAGASVSCEGSCMGSCQGECTAQGGVACNGKCEGTCSASDNQGNCTGTCNGTCKATAPSAMCMGSCKGSCSATCQASAGASVKCDGTCAGDFEPLKCEGGKLEGGCDVKAECKGSCDASVSAKAECTPPRITYALKATGAVSADATAAFGRLKATFEANLPIVFSFAGRLEGMLEVGGTLAANVSGIADIKPVCIPVVLKAAEQAVGDVQVSFQAAGSITTAAK